MTASASTQSQTSAPDSTQGRRRAAVGVALILVAQLMLIIDATIVQVALPRIHSDLHFSPASLVWVVSGYTLPYGGLLLLGGRLGDVRGRLRTFEIGLALFTVASLMGGLAQDAGWLVAARAVQGAGAALTAPGVLALLTVNAPDEAARHRAFALFAAVTSGGMTLGLVLGGIIVDVASWRWTLFVNVPLGIMVLILAPRFVKETGRRPGRFDVTGAVTATLGSGCVVWALVSAPQDGWTSAPTLAGLFAGAALLLALAVTETRSAHPMIEPALLRSAPRVAALLVSALVIAAQMSTFYFLVQLLQTGLGLSPLEAGLAFIPMTAGIFLMSRLAPKATARFGLSTLIGAGTALQVGALVLLAFRASTANSYFTSAFAPMLLDGLALGAVLMPVTALAMKDVPAEQAGSTSGLLQTGQQLGAATGLAIVVTVYASHAVTGQFFPGLSEAFLTSASLSALALLIALAIAVKKARQQHG
jgi:EmrB/QacA subfamily drug resistance transporter